MPIARAARQTFVPTSARRAFLQAVLGERTAGASSLRDALDARQIALLKDVAARWAGGLPKGALPRIAVSPACRNHGVCAAVCPTSALRTYVAGAIAGLEFEPAACIGCGVCAVVCPEDALSFGAAAPQARQSTYVATRHAQRECTRCDNAFVVSGNEELCSACRKDVSLSANAFPTRSDAA